MLCHADMNACMLTKTSSSCMIDVQAKLLLQRLQHHAADFHVETQFGKLIWGCMYMCRLIRFVREAACADWWVMTVLQMLCHADMNACMLTKTSSSCMIDISKWLASHFSLSASMCKPNCCCKDYSTMLPISTWKLSLASSYEAACTCADSLDSSVRLHVPTHEWWLCCNMAS